MRLSKLQKYILLKCNERKDSTTARNIFYDFYTKKEQKENKKSILTSTHASLENLVEKDLIVALGRKTARKWYIEKVKLTARGRKLALKTLKSRQRRLPIR